MTEINDLQRKIDAVDDEIVSALNRRFGLSADLCAARRKMNLPAKDPDREQSILQRVIAASPAAERDTVFGVYERIFNGERGVIETIARGVCLRDGKVLLCRAKGGKTTYLPGGHIEFGETAAVALAREVLEETGRVAKVGHFLGAIENSFEQHGKPHSEINLVYAMTIEGSASVESAENWISFEWCSLDDLHGACLLPQTMLPLITEASARNDDE